MFPLPSDEGPQDTNLVIQYIDLMKWIKQEEWCLITLPIPKSGLKFNEAYLIAGTFRDTNYSSFSLFDKNHNNFVTR